MQSIFGHLWDMEHDLDERYRDYREEPRKGARCDVPRCDQPAVSVDDGARLCEWHEVTL